MELIKLNKETIISTLAVSGIILGVGIRYYISTRSALRVRLWNTVDWSLNDIVDDIHNNKGHFTRILLTDAEKTNFMMAHSVSTLTFYEGDMPVAYIRTRLALIIQHNPWLLSRLFKLPYYGITAVYPNSKLLLDDIESIGCFEVVSNSELHHTMSYTNLSSSTIHLTVKKGNDCINKDEPLFKVVLIEIEARKRYAVMMSLSHVVGDGHTFYRVHSMLHPTATCTAMVPTRKQSIMEDVRLSQGNKFIDFLMSAKFVFGLVRGIYCFPTPTISAFYLNKEWIQDQKDTYARTHCDQSSLQVPPFISTNDIVTSWLCNLFKPSYAFMAYNLRNRMKGYNDDLAGNYETILMYCPMSYSKPEYIRQSIDTMKPRNETIPSFFQALENKYMVITNWTTFYSEVLYEGSSYVSHIPLVPATENCFRDLVCIYTPSKGSIAVLTVNRTVSEDVLMQQNAIEKCIC